MLNNIHSWPSLKDLDLLPHEKLHSGTWGMARSSMLLKNLTSLVVGNVLGGKNLLILGTINVTIHLTDLPGTSVLDVTPNHNLSTSKCDCLLGEPWVQMGPWGSSTILAALGIELNWQIKKSYFLLSNLPSGCGPWRAQHGFLAVSCLLLVSGQQYDCGDHCEQESDIQFLMKQASLASTPPGAVRRTRKLSSRAVILCSLPDLGLSWMSPVSWKRLRILSTCHLDTSKMSATSAGDLGLQILDDQHLFLVWSWAC